MQDQHSTAHFKLYFSVTLIPAVSSFWQRTSCAGGRHNMPPPRASWPLTFRAWKWCPSRVWRGLPLCQF